MKLSAAWKTEKELRRKTVSASVREGIAPISNLYHLTGELVCTSLKPAPITLPHILEKI